MGLIASICDSIDETVEQIDPIVKSHEMELFKKYIIDTENDLIKEENGFYLLTFNSFWWSSMIILSDKYRNLFENINHISNISNAEIEEIKKYFVIDAFRKVNILNKIREINSKYPISYQDKFIKSFSQSISAAIYLSICSYKACQFKHSLIFSNILSLIKAQI